MTTPTIDWINAADSERDDRERRICEVAEGLDRAQARASDYDAISAELDETDKDLALALRNLDVTTTLAENAVAKLAKVEAHARAHYWDDLELRDLLGAGDDDTKAERLPRCEPGRHDRARTDVATGITTCLDCGEGWTS